MVKIQTSELETWLECCCSMKMTHQTGRMQSGRRSWTGARDEPHELETVIDHHAQPDTDVPGVWRCQVEPRSDLYGDRTGKLFNPEKVIKGRLTELKHMNDHHVYDWIDEADIPKGTKVETSRWLDDLKPRDGDENHVRSRIVVQQYNVDKRLDVHQGTHHR